MTPTVLRIKFDGSEAGVIVENGIGVSRSNGAITLNYNDVWGNNSNYSDLTAATTDISVDSQFTDFMGKDFTLKVGSPCLTSAMP